MNLEQRIKYLERKLALKKAYETVSVSFGRGNKLSEEIRKEVTESVKQFCEAMANKIDKTEQSTAAISKTLDTPKEIQETPIKLNEPIIATLMTTDSLSQEMKKKISSMTEVKVMSLNDTHASVVTNDKFHYRLNVPKADIELIK